MRSLKMSLFVLALSVVGVLAFADTTPPTPPDFTKMVVDVVNAMTPILVVAIVWIARLAIPKIPRFVLPLIALASGPIIQLIINASGGQSNLILGALLGMAAVFVREFFNTLSEHGGGS